MGTKRELKTFSQLAYGQGRRPLECLMSAAPRDEDIEAEARLMLREKILQSGWYRNVSESERERLIEQDVERYWHLCINEAAARLTTRPTQESSC